MSVLSIKATRMELTRLKRKLVTAMRGHKLLKDKRDELIRQFLELIKENYSLREELEGEIHKSSRNFALARSLVSDYAIDTALIMGSAAIEVELGRQNIMGINVPVFRYDAKNNNCANSYPYGFAYTSSELDSAIENVSSIIPSMLRLAELEKTCQILSCEIERTRRRVNALEHVVIPEAQSQIRFIKMKLDENERSSQVRIMKVKDMILAKAHGYSK